MQVFGASTHDAIGLRDNVSLHHHGGYSEQLLVLTTIPRCVRHGGFLYLDLLKI